jgi:hypothetical protein
MAWLSIINGFHAGAAIRLGPGRWTVGCDLDADIVLSDLDAGAGYSIVVKGWSATVIGNEGPNGTSHLIHVGDALSLGPVNARFTALAPKGTHHWAMASVHSMARVGRSLGQLAPRALIGAPVFGCAMTLGIASPVDHGMSRPTATLAEVLREAETGAHLLPRLTALETSGAAVISGALTHPGDLHRIKAAVQAKWHKPLIFHVAVMEKMVPEIESAALSMHLTVTVSVRDDELVLTGFAWNDEEKSRFLKIVKEEIAQFSNVLDEIWTPQLIAQAVAEAAARDNLKSAWKLKDAGASMQLRVRLAGESERDAWAQLMQRIVPAGIASLVKLDLVDPLSLPAIDGVNLARHPTLLLEGGGEVRVGSLLGQRNEIVAIDDDGVLVRSDDETIRVPYSRPPHWIVWENIDP